MDLRTYIFTQRTTASRIARDLGINAEYLRQINRGLFRPSDRIIKMLETYSGGQITENDLLARWREAIA